MSHCQHSFNSTNPIYIFLRIKTRKRVLRIDFQQNPTVCSWSEMAQKCRTICGQMDGWRRSKPFHYLTLRAYEFKITLLNIFDKIEPKYCITATYLAHLISFWSPRHIGSCLYSCSWHNKLGEGLHTLRKYGLSIPRLYLTKLQVTNTSPMPISNTIKLS